MTDAVTRAEEAYARASARARHAFHALTRVLKRSRALVARCERAHEDEELALLHVQESVVEASAAYAQACYALRAAKAAYRQALRALRDEVKP